MIFLTPDQIQTKYVEAYKQRGALFVHDGNWRRPHPVLRSKKHAKKFWDTRILIADRELLRDAARDLLDLFLQQGGDLSEVDGVVGPQTGATLLAELLSERITAITGKPCFFASPAKKKDGEQVVGMVFDDTQRALLPGKKILLCEDVITTGGSIGRTVKSIIDAGGIPLSFVVLLVNRSGQPVVDEKTLIALINDLDENSVTWEPENCELCAVGSEALEDVKEPEKWAKLTATYPTTT